jgi:hypothetical protein
MDCYFLRDILIFLTYLAAVQWGMYIERSYGCAPAQNALDFTPRCYSLQLGLFPQLEEVLQSGNDVHSPSVPEVPNLEEFSERLTLENWRSADLPGDKTCPYSNDGTCDEGIMCVMGTDKADCLKFPRPVLIRGTARLVQDQLWVPHKCFEKEPPVAIAVGMGDSCEKRTSRGTCFGPCEWKPKNPTVIHTCPYKNDGVCDEGSYCSSGTDFNDCCGKEGEIKKDLDFLSQKILNPAAPELSFDRWLSIIPRHFANCGHTAWLYR